MAMEQGPQNPDPYPEYLKVKTSGGAAAEVPEHTHANDDEAGALAGYATTADLAGYATTGDLAGLQATSEKGAANGYAGLGSGGLVPTAQLGTGTPSGSKYLRDDQTWQTVSGGSGLTQAQVLARGTGA